MDKLIAIYARVSSKSQDTRSQDADLKRWAEAQGIEPEWYRDSATGTNLDRPGFERLMSRVAGGLVGTVVVWRLDRLGRTASGLTALFEDLNRRRVNLVSLKDGLDLSTPAGRLMANVLASVAAYETEVRQERQAAGIAAAKAAGVKWGGGVKGRRYKVTDEQLATIAELKGRGFGVTHIRRVTGLSRQTIYDALKVPEPTASS